MLLFTALSYYTFFSAIFMPTMTQQEEWQERKQNCKTFFFVSSSFRHYLWNVRILIYSIVRMPFFPVWNVHLCWQRHNQESIEFCFGLCLLFGDILCEFYEWAAVYRFQSVFLEYHMIHNIWWWWIGRVTFSLFSIQFDRQLDCYSIFPFSVF